jgi:hypothetical protein
MDGTLYNPAQRITPTKTDTASELFETMFQRAMNFPEQVHEAFPEGCPQGTVAKILETAISVNPSNTVGFSAWLLVRWCEGRLTLKEMKQSGPILAEYSRRAADLPIESRNVFGMHSLHQIEQVLARADQPAVPELALFSARTDHSTLRLA